MKTSQAAAIALGRAFGETVDPEGHVPRPASESRLDALAAWCRSDGAGSTVAALVAPPGIGKTHLLRVLESRLLEDERARPGESGGSGEETPGSPSVRPCSRALYLPYAALTLPDLARWIQGLVGGRWPLRVATADPDEDALRALAGLAAGPRRPLHLLIDDADSMPTATLRALVQGLARERSPLRLVLALSDDSRAARMLAALDPLRPLELPYRDALDEPETGAYLRARLAWSGLGAELLGGLDPRTVARIHALSGGIPRRIHRVVLALVEPDRAALARALATSSRSDAWLGRPIDDSF